MKTERVKIPPHDWDDFVSQNPNGSLSHAGVWLPILREAYGVETLGLVARSEENGTIEGVLPLAIIHTLGRRKDLVSMPYLDGGGILAGNAAAEGALIREAISEGNTVGARAVELRQEHPLPSLPAPGCDRVRMVLPLPEGAEELWNRLPGKVRNQVRKARKEGLVGSSGRGDRELEGFHDPYRRNMRELGSPAHGRPFFETAARGFGERLRCFVAWDGERPIGGLVAIHYGDTVTVPWASTLRSERSRCPNNLIYWEALEWAVARGARAFDFGRSPPGSGTYRFKRGWGAVEEPLAWLRLDAEGAATPLIHPGDSPLLRRAAWMWKRMPAPLCHWLGPRVRPRLAS